MTFSLAKMLHKTLPTDRDRRALLGQGLCVCAGAILREQQAARGGKPFSFRAAITEPAEGGHPRSTMWGRKHSLAPQGTVNKKLLSLESQQGNDGRRLGPSNERKSPSEPR